MLETDGNTNSHLSLCVSKCVYRCVIHECGVCILIIYRVQRSMSSVLLTLNIILLRQGLSLHLEIDC